MDRQGPRIGAALFNGDHARLADELARLEEADVDFVHLDVFDGHFVPDLGFPPRTIATLRALSDLPFEVHLGTLDPLRFLPHLADAGVDLVIFHVESVPLLYETIYAAREGGVRVGLALTLGTPIAALGPVVSLVDAVLLLSRVTGEGERGSEFNPLVLPRLKEARALMETAGADLDLQVAGGIEREHAPRLVSAGASTLALGGGLYRAADMGREVAALRSLGAGVG